MTPAIHRIVIPTPFPVGPVNAYLLPGEPVTLVDTGPRTRAARAALEEGLAAFGVPLRGIGRILLTHGHLDHFGQAAAVAAESGAEIWAHPGDAPKLAGLRAMGDLLPRFLRRHGVPDPAIPPVVETYMAMRRLADPVEAFRPLNDGDRISAGGAEWEVLHTPGHSAGHLCLRSGGTLIAGDVLLEEITPNPIAEYGPDGERTPTLPLLLDSLRRLEGFDVAEVLPGHGAPFGPAAARIRQMLEAQERRQREVAALLGGSPQTAFALAGALFPGMDTLNLILALSEILGQLDLIIAAGGAEEVALDEGRVGYRLGGGAQDGRGAQG